MAIINKVRIRILGIGILVLSFAACSNQQSNADKYLESARTHLHKGDYEASRALVDSIRILFPQAYPQIRAGILLTDSIDYANNKAIIESLSKLIDQHQQSLNVQKNTNDQSYIALANTIDSLKMKRDTCRNIINGLEEKALKAAARCQCKVRMRK